MWRKSPKATTSAAAFAPTRSIQTAPRRCGPRARRWWTSNSDSERLWPGPASCSTVGEIREATNPQAPVIPPFRHRGARTSSAVGGTIPFGAVHHEQVFGSSSNETQTDPPLNGAQCRLCAPNADAHSKYTPNDPRFESCEPVPSLPRGRQHVTLRDAADYIMALPMAEQNLRNGKPRSVA